MSLHVNTCINDQALFCSEQFVVFSTKAKQRVKIRMEEGWMRKFESNLTAIIEA